MRAFLRFVSCPTAIVLVALGAVRLERWLEWRGPRVVWLGELLALAGALLTSWCCALFLSRGEGTPHPFAVKTRHLVFVGPYRYVRNPMIWGVGAMVVGLALWAGSVAAWIWFGLFVLFISLFVPYYEERDMERRFGEEYREYCRRVPRWWPRIRLKM